MYSGLLPAGLSESDVELSEDSEDGSDTAEQQQQQQQQQPSNSEGDPANQAVENKPASSSKGGEEVNCAGGAGVSPHLWEKFQELQKRNSEIKTLTKQRGRKRKRRRHKLEGTQTHTESESKMTNNESQLPVPEAHWNELKQYFGVNDRFEPPPCNRPLPKTRLEENIDKAIADGDLKKAEELSDRLATRELGVKIAKAVDCREFVKAKQEAEASREVYKKKKQLAWGFEAKKRWETKSNMGYM
ncbi:protein FAM204A isoform X2 [Latimeria chalumnae]|uniref:Family with sequence similarity 204 member A n=1 Tax=Latimeria chalumnae TaxID=7897 RepID=H3AAG6_LATCH|nr:PREDICTED: protein FAM204A isoform X2 [Latimeria chalumnae]|eukprot:XP_006011006.1 PREDICTED: protein FAM204A isoform X2 [Latimeria chalumnae]